MGGPPQGGESTVSAIWNAAYDLGMAAGALSAGLVLTTVGFPATFLLAAAVVLSAVGPAWRERRTPGPTT